MWAREQSYSFITGNHSVGKTTLVVHTAKELERTGQYKFIYYECVHGTNEKFIEKFAERLYFDFRPVMPQRSNSGILSYLVKHYLNFQDNILEEEEDEKAETRKEERILGDIFDYLMVVSGKMHNKRESLFSRLKRKLLQEKKCPCPKYVLIIDGVECLDDSVIGELRENAKRLSAQSFIHVSFVAKRVQSTYFAMIKAESSRLDVHIIPEMSRQETIAYLNHSGKVSDGIQAEQYEIYTGGLHNFLKFIEPGVSLTYVQSRVGFMMNSRVAYGETCVKDLPVNLLNLIEYLYLNGGRVDSYVFLEHCCGGDREVFRKLMTLAIFTEKFNGGWLGTIEFYSRTFEQWVPHFIRARKEATQSLSITNVEE
jgi:hypothetical protein